MRMTVRMEFTSDFARRHHSLTAAGVIPSARQRGSRHAAGIAMAGLSLAVTGGRRGHAAGMLPDRLRLRGRDFIRALRPVTDGHPGQPDQCATPQPGSTLAAA